jgi:hypothetical protein
LVGAIPVDLLYIGGILISAPYPIYPTMIQLKDTTNLALWLRVFEHINQEDPTLGLNKDLLQVFEGADMTTCPEVSVLGVYDLKPNTSDSFLAITFTVHGSWDNISDIKFEVADSIEGLKLPSEKGSNIIRSQTAITSF